MLNTITKSLTLAAFATLAMSLTACGGKVESVLKDANLTLTVQDGKNVVSMQTEINTSNLMITAATLPIAKDLGTIEILSDVTTGKTYVRLSFKLGKALTLPSFHYSAKLPNGLTMPLTGVDLNRMMAFDVGTKGSKVYLYYDATTKKSVLGVALNVEALNIGTPAAVLGAFNLGNVTGVAGLYFGTAVNTSGLGIFADLSGIFSNLTSPLAVRTPIGFKEYKASDKQMKLMEQKYFELSNSRKAIKLK